MLRLLFHMLIVRPFVSIVIGLRVQGREHLPQHGPAIIAANHNSHLDTVVLMSLFPLRQLRVVRPAGAKDYFFSSPAMSWFSKKLMGVVPVDRHARERGEDPFIDVTRSLQAGDILVLFPEGSRGEPEQMAELKKGISHLIEQQPQVPLIPVYLRGLGKSLPKGSWLPVPFFCDVSIGAPLRWTGDRVSYMTALQDAMRQLASSGYAADWD